ncbi:molybdenum cofactor sulfurylase, partial [Pseudomonas putida]
TIIEEKGSTPRNAGAKMVISATALFDTIGGGHLEYKALHIAREMLAEGTRATRLERFSLGASLGQCCGGATVLLFEPVAQTQAQVVVFGAGIVMTHDHSLDLELTRAILKRNDFTWFGLIGSATKRARFEHRLRDRGIAPAVVQRMRCPMGLAAVKGKLPMEIAVSIAAEIIATYNAHFGARAEPGTASSPGVAQLLPRSRRSPVPLRDAP